LGRTKIIYVHSWHVFQREREVLSIITRHLSKQHCKGTPWRGIRQQRHPLAHSRNNKTFFIFWTEDGGSVQAVRCTWISNTVSYLFTSVQLHSNIRLVNMQQVMCTIKSIYK
jgi:hypothetical protein